ncbi:hypothetical protein [uncultured Bilophila sp.]|uniref:hypothetical protein n=1 Tax=uncultured Bilophila sp. TaxID=529385 RepID=UPI00280A63FF|nr:hypothetical protein [uncultured Bilophila sp.]
MVVSSPQYVENTAFFPIFPLAGFTAKAFCRLSLWNFKEKASTIFYNTAKVNILFLAHTEALRLWKWPVACIFP